MVRESGSAEKLLANMLRRVEVESSLSALYIRRAEKEKHLSRIIPEYSEDWESDPYVKRSERKGDEKMIGAEMVLLVAERRDLDEAEKVFRASLQQMIGSLPAPNEEDAASPAARLKAITAQIDRMDMAAKSGQKIIRATSHIKRCADQAMQFRLGSGGLSEPLKAALYTTDQMGPVLRDFYQLLGEASFPLTLRDKIKYCQVGGSDWMWEMFDYDLMGLFTRLFHRPDAARFSEVDVELLGIRYRIYSAMSRIAGWRSSLTKELIDLYGELSAPETKEA